MSKKYSFTVGKKSMTEKRQEGIENYMSKDLDLNYIVLDSIEEAKEYKIANKTPGSIFTLKTEELERIGETTEEEATEEEATEEEATEEEATEEEATEEEATEEEATEEGPRTWDDSVYGSKTEEIEVETEEEKPMTWDTAPDALEVEEVDEVAEMQEAVEANNKAQENKSMFATCPVCEGEFVKHTKNQVYDTKVCQKRAAALRKKQKKNKK
jgi:hypothetical protein